MYGGNLTYEINPWSRVPTDGIFQASEHKNPLACALTPVFAPQKQIYTL